MSDPEEDSADSREVIDDRYEIIQRISTTRPRGWGNGVFIAHDLLTEQEIVLKLIRTGGNQKDVHRLVREAVALAANAAPNVVRLLGHGTLWNDEDGPDASCGYFLALEQIPGASLAARLLASEEGRFDVLQAVRTVERVLEAIHPIHERRWVHRDLKPSNVMGDEHGVVLLDFELAQECGANGRRSRRLTDPGIVVGTPKYLSPEVVRGADADRRSDIHGIGAMLYELLSGAFPYGDRDEPAYLQRLAMDAPRHISGIASVPPEVADVTMRALERDPCARYQTAEDMRAALVAALS